MMMKSTRRAELFKVIALSLFASSTGFSTQGQVTPLNSLMTSSTIHSSSLPTELGISRGESSTCLNMAATRKSALMDAPKQERLTREEESELLRQAMEFRRLDTLETELRLHSPNRELPLLSVRAKAAGYGDEILEYEDALADGQIARETLVTRNMGLVHYTVNQILSKRKNRRMNSLSYDDLVQEGAIGLARAIDRWNPAIGGRFATYAMYWVRACVFRCIAERDDILRVPSHVSQAVRDVNKAAKRLSIDLDAQGPLSASWREANAAKKLAEEAGLSDSNFEEAMKARTRRYTGGYVTFESWMQMGDNLESDVPMPREEQSSAAVETEHLRTTLSKFLRPKEMEALSWRYGLVDEEEQKAKLAEETQKQKANRYLAEAEEKLFGQTTGAKRQPKKQQASIPARGRWGEAMTFTEVGNRMQVSAEYGRKLCHAALAKLKQAAEDGRLEPALLY